MVYGHNHYHEHGGGDGGGSILFGIAVVGFLFLGVITAYVDVLRPVMDMLLWTCLIGYPVFAYVRSRSIAVAVRTTLLAWGWCMISGMVVVIPLLLIAGFVAHPNQVTNVITVGVNFAGIIGMGFYTLLSDN
jgi:hypothetical protein